MNEPDPALIRAAQWGDRAAYAELVRAHYEPVRRYLARLLGDDSLAEDVTQETFTRCYRSLDRYAFEGRFTTWLVQIARNAGIDAMRHRTRHARLVSLAPLPDPPSDPAASAELDAALSALPTRLREALLLVEVVGFRYREAAVVLGVPEGTVKSRVSHARERLVEWFNAHEQEAGDAVL